MIPNATAAVRWIGGLAVGAAVLLLTAGSPATARKSFRDRPTAFHYGRTATDDRVTWMTGMPSPWTGKLTVRLDESRDSPPR